MADLPKVGDWVVRTKYPSKYLEADKAYKVVAVVIDDYYNSGWKLQLEGVEPFPNGALRWFDPTFFTVVGNEWVVGAKVMCVFPDADTKWPKGAAKLGGTYTVKHINSSETHITLVETDCLYKKSDFELIGSGPYVPKPSPKVVIYNQQGNS